MPRHPWGESFECQFDWGEAMVQCGGHGIVIGKKDNSYTTAFFEAFPLNTFIRGEGEHVELAELAAWEKYQRIVLCDKHEFERRGREDDYGFCKHCDYFTSGVFKILTKCETCSEPTKDHKTGTKYWCTEHYYGLDWTTDIKPSAPSYFLENFLEKNFKINKKCREWIKKTKKTLTPNQIEYFCRVYESFDSTSKPETDHLLFSCIYNIILTNPATVSKQDVLNEINKILE